MKLQGATQTDKKQKVSYIIINTMLFPYIEEGQYREKTKT